MAHSYKKGDPVLLLRGTENKYEAPYQGPYKITKVNDNGTVCLKIGAVEEVINLRRLTPYIPANAPDHGGECSMPLCRKGKSTKLVPEKSIRTKLVPAKSNRTNIVPTKSNRTKRVPKGPV